jgi:uncharacterized membrane protein
LAEVEFTMKRVLFNPSIRKFAPLLVALAAVISSAGTLWACPTCSEAAAANDPEHEHMVKGYFYSILFMMGMSYIIFTCFAGYMYWEVKKARARKAAEEAALAANAKKPLLPAAAAAVTPEDSFSSLPPAPIELPPAEELVEV